MKQVQYIYTYIVAGWSNERYIYESTSSCFDGYASKHNLVEEETVHSLMKQVQHIYIYIVAGWSSSVARWAHNPKVAGSNPAPATKNLPTSINLPC